MDKPFAKTSPEDLITVKEDVTYMFGTLPNDTDTNGLDFTLTIFPDMNAIPLFHLRAIKGRHECYMLVFFHHQGIRTN